VLEGYKSTFYPEIGLCCRTEAGIDGPQGHEKRTSLLAKEQPCFSQGTRQSIGREKVWGVAGHFSHFCGHQPITKKIRGERWLPSPVQTLKKKLLSWSLNTSEKIAPLSCERMGRMK
jgi:hypothetical protein